MEKKKSKIIHIINLILIAVVSLILVVVIMTLIKGLQIKLFADSGNIAHAMNYEHYYLSFFQIELTIVLIALEINRFNQNNFFKRIKRHSYFTKGTLALILLNILVLSSSLLSSTFIYEKHMVVRNPMHVHGLTYHLEDVVQVETGYSKVKRENGAFYYNLTMQDAYVLEVNACYPREPYIGDNMYSWLQALDQRLMAMPLDKIVDLESEKDSYDYADKYKVVFSSIMLNS